MVRSPACGTCFHPGTSPWTEQPTAELPPRIPFRRCPRNSRDSTSDCDSPSSTIPTAIKPICSKTKKIHRISDGKEVTALVARRGCVIGHADERPLSEGHIKQGCGCAQGWTETDSVDKQKWGNRPQLIQQKNSNENTVKFVA